MVATAPKWLRTASRMLVLYTAVMYFDFVLKTYPDQRASARSNPFVLGAFNVAIYSTAAMFLMAYLCTDDPPQVSGVINAAR